VAEEKRKWLKINGHIGRFISIDMLRVAGGKMEILRRSGSNNSDLTFHDMIFTASERDFAV